MRLGHDDALVGHTGFVGGNLLRQASFGCLFNSSNFREMRGRSFGTVVCAGVSAAKWLANRDPEGDRARIADLEAVLSTVEAEHFILVSTVDVYPAPTGVDEADDPEGLPNHAYGRNRLALESFVRRRWPEALILRLPALFGSGLRKNALFDLHNGRLLDQINPASSFQWYDVSRLWSDAGRAREAGLRLLNIAVEPVATCEIVERLFPGAVVSGGGAPVSYDMRTRFSAQVSDPGAPAGYLSGKEDCLARMAAFLASEPKGASA